MVVILNCQGNHAHCFQSNKYCYLQIQTYLVLLLFAVLHFANIVLFTN